MPHTILTSQTDTAGDTLTFLGKRVRSASLSEWSLDQKTFGPECQATQNYPFDFVKSIPLFTCLSIKIPKTVKKIPFQIQFI